MSNPVPGRTEHRRLLHPRRTVLAIVLVLALALQAAASPAWLASGLADEVGRGASDAGTATPVGVSASGRYLVTHTQASAREVALTPLARSRQRAGVSQAVDQLDELVVDLAGNVERRYSSVPTIEAVLSPEGATALARSPYVADLQPIRVFETSLDDALERSVLDDRSLEAALGPLTTGAGTAIAIVDSGVERDHPFLAGGDGSRVVAEACFSVGGDCPGGRTTVVGTGAAQPLDGDGHGTHVAGIAAGWRSGAGGPARGVAPAADILAAQVFSRAGEDGITGSSADLLAALEWVAAEAVERPVAAVNLSLGSQQTFAGACDSGADDPFVRVVEELRARGVLTISSAGNGQQTSGESWPACLSNVVSVAASDQDDELASFTNVSDATDLAAPGVQILSSVPGGGFAMKSGTSMAAPLVSGAVALLAERSGHLPPSELESALQTSSTSLHDQREGGQRTALPRLDGVAALLAVGPAGELAAPTLSVTSLDLLADIGWSAVDGADTYELFRSTTATCSAASKQLYAGPSQRWEDHELVHGVQYRYCVRARDADGVAGPLSVGASITAVDLTPPAPPSLRATARATQVELSWPTVSDPTGPVVYRVYRSTGSTCTRSDVRVYRGTGRSMLDGKLAPATTYRYCATATDAAGNRSPLSPDLRVRTKELPPGPVWYADDELTFSVIDGGVRLRWPGGSGAGELRYEVARDGRRVTVTSTRAAPVTGLRPGSSYRLEVRIVDENGRVSAPLRRRVTPTAGFRDTRGRLFEDDVTWLATAGVTRGCNPPLNDRYCPTEAVTREQMAAFLVRALGLTRESGVRFRDVPARSTFARDIDRLATAGVTRGCNPPRNDRFCPGDPVSREQMAAFLVRGWNLRETSASGTFTDVSTHGTFATDVNRLATAGVTRGCNPPHNSRYCPDQPVTREQMAAFLRRAAS